MSLRLAHRPLPSIIIATCRGIFLITAKSSATSFAKSLPRQHILYSRNKLADDESELAVLLSHAHYTLIICVFIAPFAIIMHYMHLFPLLLQLVKSFAKSTTK